MMKGAVDASNALGEPSVDLDGPWMCVDVLGRLYRGFDPTLYERASYTFASTMTCCIDVCEQFGDPWVPDEVKLIVSGTGQLLAFA